MSNQHRNKGVRIPAHDGSRRDFIKTMGGVAAGAGALASGLWSFPAFAAPRGIRLGYVTPQTGPLAPFAATDLFVIETMRKAALKQGISINGRQHPVEILVKDSQSDPNRAATVASDLILDNEVDLMLVASTPETTNPVADQCELNGVPCISTVAPWQPWFFTRGGAPDQGFAYTYHFFWGLEDIIRVFTTMWQSLDTNKVVAGLWPNDGDGNAWSDAQRGFPPVLKDQGFEVVDPGRYQNMTDDFSAQISRFKEAGAEILTGVPIPPDFTTFWTQAAQKGFRPKAATVGKALLFPEAVEALGDRGAGVSSEVWWTPSHPFQSSLTGQSAGELAAAWESGADRQWTQPLGFAHALFEVAADVLKRSQDLDSPESIVQAIKETRVDTIVGTVDWSGGPVPNVAKTPLVGGQWKPGEKFKYDLRIVANPGEGHIPVEAAFEPLS